MFRLTRQEAAVLTSQFVMSKNKPAVQTAVYFHSSLRDYQRITITAKAEGLPLYDDRSPRNSMPFDPLFRVAALPQQLTAQILSLARQFLTLVAVLFRHPRECANDRLSGHLQWNEACMRHFVVLSISKDPALLKTRSLLLRNAGYTVLEQSSINAAAKQFLSADIDAVLVCHSLAPDQKSQLIDLVRSHSPSTPILMISDRVAEADRRVDAVVENEPESLLLGIEAVSNRPPKIGRTARKQA
jgi:CheY-like chemotaxis protein